MSTDIRIFAECLQDGQWTPLSRTEDLSKESHQDLSTLEIIDIGRHYEFFTVLAGVRRERFLKWSGADVRPISRPRGLPKDLSPLLKSYIQDDDGWGASWLMVQEVINFDWEQSITFYGLVEPQYANLFSDNQPFPYEQWPENAHCYSLNSNYLPKADIVQVSWVESYREFVGSEFLDYFFEKLLALGSPKEVRIIFYFY
ncbi:hypothetical protein IQ244_29105 [Nostoc sp. LEGE 06077]|uniref:hypothetical protein n=1 Tax=Nostoc sp. LEGE 06077 TaxID=915325 RepID=UPI00187E01F4|nr:hypothetical protein [Nostoc sp. LEGE 06077]MBE9210489.1 hypothetical protein [Nostoc sp. LEGE 06077]